MPVTQRRRSYQLFRKMKFSSCASTATGDEGNLEIDKMILHVFDCLGALQCVMGQYDSARAKVFWGAVATIADVGVDQAIGHVDKRHPGASQLLRAFPNDLKVTDGRGWLPLHWAAVTDDVNVNDVLSIARADPMATVKGCNQPISATPGHLIAAVRYPRMEVVRGLYNFYPRMASAKDSDGDLPLHYAARYSESLDMIHFLLQANPLATKVRGEGNLVPLQHALFNESSHKMDIVKALLSADPSAASILTADGDTVFHIAINQECSEELLRHLYRAFPEGVRMQNDIGHLPLHAACLSRDLPRSLQNVRMLLEVHPGAARVPCIYGHLPAHVAAELSNAEVLEEVLMAYPDAAIAQSAEDNGNTPLIKAVVGGNQNTVEYLCRERPDCAQVCSAQGLTAMHFAAEGDSLAILRTVNAVNAQAVRRVDDEGRLPLHVFAQVHQEPLLEYSCEADCLRFLLRLCPQAVICPDLHGDTPLALVASDNVYMRRLLLRIQPQVAPQILGQLNYQQRRLGLFLATAAINATGIPNVFQQLHSVDQSLLRLTLSFL